MPKEEKGGGLITGLSILSVILLIAIAAVVIIGLLWPRISGSQTQDTAFADPISWKAVYGAKEPGGTSGLL